MAVMAERVCAGLWDQNKVGSTPPDRPNIGTY